MMRKRPTKKLDPAPTGMLDAYTEGPAGGGSGMSDSDKFKEGYKKKGKGKGPKGGTQPQPVKKPEVVEESQEEEIEQEPVVESWDDEVVDSWEQMEVEQMPVPVKVRRDEKKKRKELEKASKQQEKTPEKSENCPNTDELNETQSETSGPNVVVKPKEESLPTEPVTTETKDIIEGVKQMTISNEKHSQEGNVNKKPEMSEEEKAAVKADREAKKAAKAAKVAAAKQKKASEVSDTPAPSNNEAVVDDKEKKSKEELKAERRAEFEAKQKEVKAAPTSTEEGGKSKAELKAERRAKQEAQRAAKENKQQKPVASQENRVRVSDEVKADDKKAEKKLEKTLASQKVPARTPVQKQVALFSHLHQYKRDTGELTRELKVGGETNIHPAILQMGLQHAEGKVTGSTDRAISLLVALKTLLMDLVPSIQQQSGTDVFKEIDNIMKPNITFLKQCRPLSISMGNAIRYLKKEIQNLDRSLGVNEIKENIIEIIDDFVNVNFVLHPKAISETANKKIKNGDTILTFSHSKLVEKVLLDAASSGTKFKVVVTEARVPELPAQSGARALARLLVSAGVHTTYILLTGLEQVIESVTSVMMGCEGVMANGCVLATVGTSQVALLAAAHNKPVLVCCESYKFSRRVQTDSFVYNELGDPADLDGKSLEGWQDQNSLSLLNLVYDLTPASLVTSIITESSQIPPTSVPVILRLNNMMESDISV